MDNPYLPSRTRPSAYKPLLVWVVIVLTTLGMLIPLLPGGKKDPLGLGSFWPVLEFNKTVAARSPHHPETRAQLRFLGQFGKQKTAQLMQAVQQVKAAVEAERLSDVHVQVRGFARNEAWVLAYDFYPIKVIGRYADEGGFPNDPILPEADWTLTQRKQGRLRLERVP
ncbi:MAG: hypothetical protein KJ645_03465 [Planctomycetes bacterium]|nr:hypothetical protein [Planctomycetota bacterium]